MSTPSGFKNIDWTQYQTWPRIVGANGHVYYIPPGGEGYLYDPFTHHVFIDARDKKKIADAEKKQQEDAIAAQKEANSPGRQLTNIGAVAGITAGVPIAANNLFPVKTAADKLIELEILKQGGGGKVATDVATNTLPNANAAAQGALGGGDAGVSAANAGGAGEVSNLANAGEAVPNAWATAPEMGSIGSIAGLAAGAYGTYNAINAMGHGGEGLRSGLTTAGMGFGGAFGGPVGAAIGGIGGNVLGYGLQGDGWKNDAALAALGPVGWTALAAKKFGVVDSLMHETTQQVQQKNTARFAQDAEGDQAAMDYVMGARKQNIEGRPEGESAFGDSKGNKYDRFEDYEAGGLDAANLEGVAGNLKTYGVKQWAALTPQQRLAITQGNIDAKNYDPEKGEVLIKDEAKARSIYDSVLAQSSPGTAAVVAPPPPGGSGFNINGQQPAVAAPLGAAPIIPAAAAAQSQLQIVNPPRSMTQSPGINWKGQRIVY